MAASVLEKLDKTGSELYKQHLAYPLFVNAKYTWQQMNEDEEDKWHLFNVMRIFQNIWNL